MKQSGIILDKCFLQGASPETLKKLSNRFQLLMPDVLFYELISSIEPHRSRCFSKFPKSGNPIPVTEHVGALLRKEIETHEPCGLPSENLVDINYRFNPSLASGNYEFTENDIEAQKEIEEELNNDISNLINRSNSLGELFPDFHNKLRKEQKAYAQEVMGAVATDISGITTFLSKLEYPDGNVMPSEEWLNPSWAIFRWFQVQLLFAIDIASRYGILDEAHLTSKLRIKLEHDVLDSHYLIQGLLEKSFATKEKKLKGFFKLLCPEGMLVCENG